jgi:hypothetical protein
MATTAEIDIALAALRSARVALAQAADKRARAVLTRDSAATALTLATSTVQSARDLVATRKAAVQALLSTTET